MNGFIDGEVFGLALQNPSRIRMHTTPRDIDVLLCHQRRKTLDVKCCMVFTGDNVCSKMIRETTLTDDAR